MQKPVDEKSLLRIAAVAVFFGLWSVANPAFAQDGDRLASPLDCSAILPGGLQGCVLRMPAGYEAPSIEATKLSDGSSISEDWKLLSASELANNAKAELSGTLILVDVSRGGPGRRAIFERDEKAALKSLVAAMPAEEQLSLVAFGAERKDLVPFTRDRQSILSAIDALELTETNTLVQRSLMDAIRLVSAQPTLAIGRVLILSDGLDEDVQQPQEVINLAKQAGVSISALASFWQGSGNPDIGRGLGYLRSIVEATKGELGQAEYRKTEDAKTSIAEFARRISLARTSSRLVVLNETATPVRSSIMVKVERPVVAGSAQRESVEFKADFIPLDANGNPLPEEVSPKPEEKTEAPKPKQPPASQPVTGLEAAWTQAKKFTIDYWYVLLGAALLVLGAIALIATRNRQSGDDDLNLSDFGDVALGEPPNTPDPMPAAEIVLAVLVEKTTGRRIKITANRVSIGRGTKNDIVLNDNSISRAHAILQIESNGFMAITDLQSLNGTFVNGNRVSETKQIKFGDAVKLGEYQVFLQQS